MLVSLEKQVPLAAQYDVLVAGSGPAGICAAIAAARLGCRVALAERYGTVGGNMTVGHIRTCMGVVPQSPLLREMGQRLRGSDTGLAHQTERAKITLTQWLAEEDVTVYLQTPVVEVYKQENRVTGLFVSTQQGLQLLTAHTVIDATGDGFVAAAAGVPCDYGRQDGLVQPASVMFTVNGIDPDCTLVCTHEKEDTPMGNSTYITLCREASRRGELPANVHLVQLYATPVPGERLVNATQMNGVNGLQAADVWQSQVALRQQMEQIVSFLQKTVPGFSHCAIMDSGDIVGFRETRRPRGQYVLSSRDIAAGAVFADAVVHRAYFPFDIHNPAGGGQAESFEESHTAQFYDIPYRCLLPLEAEGLLLAGRCISGTHRAHSSYRVMNICMATGEAAGTAAALCSRQNIQPTQLEPSALQARLETQGVLLKEN